MDHVDADHRIGPGYRPGSSHHIKHQGRQKIGKRRFRPPGCDAGKGSGIGISRLKGQRREMLSEMQRVFARTARDFKYQT